MSSVRNMYLEFKEDGKGYTCKTPCLSHVYAASFANVLRATQDAD